MQRIGVMGGTFDPIHHGHLVAASEVAASFELDEVVFVPTGAPWQKVDRTVSPAEDRYLMTVIATASDPRFSVSRVDVDRDGPTYTLDTLRDLQGVYPAAGELYFITGADALAQLLTWRDVDALFALAHFVGVTRPGHVLADPRPAVRRGEPGGGPCSGHLLHRDTRPGDVRASDRLPGPGGCRPLHQQAPAVPAGRRVTERHRHRPDKNADKRGQRAARPRKDNVSLADRLGSSATPGSGPATVLPAGAKTTTVQPQSRRQLREQREQQQRRARQRWIITGAAVLGVVVLGVLLVVWLAGRGDDSVAPAEQGRTERTVTMTLAARR